MEKKLCVSPKTFDVNNLVFEDAKDGEMNDGTSFRKTKIKIKRPDRSDGPLYVVTEPCFSFGITKDDKYGGYSIPLALLDIDGPTKRQKDFVKMMRKILLACNPKPKSCFYGNEENIIMYLRVDYDKISGEFFTNFYEREDMSDATSTKEIDPKKYMGKNCLAKMVILIDNIFEAKTTSLQMRVKTVVFSKARKRNAENFLKEI